MARFKASQRSPLKPVLVNGAWGAGTPPYFYATFNPNDVAMDQGPDPNGGYFRMVIDGQPWALVFDTWTHSTVARFTHGSPTPAVSATIQCIKADKDCRNLGGSYIVPGPAVVWYP